MCPAPMKIYLGQTKGCHQIRCVKFLFLGPQRSLENKCF